jgi:hypothetical protein
MRLLLIFILLCGIVTINSCSKDPDTNDMDQTNLYNDAAMYQEITNGSFYYYQSDTATLTAAGNSPHGTFKLLFNQEAKNALGTDGKLAVGDTFPTGSIILKDVIRNGTTRFYAAMWKQPASSNTNEDWLWYEANLDGSLLVSITAKGNGCIGCHRANTNRDFTNSFDVH